MARKAFLNLSHALKGTAGFTLAEVLLSAGLLIVLFFLVTVLFHKGQNLMDVVTSQGEIQKNARRMTQSVSAILRQARRSALAIPLSPNNTSISFDLPIFFEASGTCSAYALVADGTAPVSCDSDSECQMACTSGFCSNQVCRRNYSLSLSTASGMPQLVLSASGESDRVIGNYLQSVNFFDNTMDTNLQANEIRVSLATSSNATSEKTMHTMNLSTIVQIRN